MNLDTFLKAFVDLDARVRLWIGDADKTIGSPVGNSNGNLPTAGDIICGKMPQALYLFWNVICVTDTYCPDMPNAINLVIMPPELLVEKDEDDEKQT